MSQSNLQIVYYIWCPQISTGDVTAKRTSCFDEHVAWLKTRSAEGTLREWSLPSRALTYLLPMLL